MRWLAVIALPAVAFCAPPLSIVPLIWGELGRGVPLIQVMGPMAVFRRTCRRWAAQVA
jgi:hypothetical protein